MKKSIWKRIMAFVLVLLMSVPAVQLDVFAGTRQVGGMSNTEFVQAGNLFGDIEEDENPLLIMIPSQVSSAPNETVYFMPFSIYQNGHLSDELPEVIWSVRNTLSNETIIHPNGQLVIGSDEANGHEFEVLATCANNDDVYVSVVVALTSDEEKLNSQFRVPSDTMREHISPLFILSDYLHFIGELDSNEFLFMESHDSIDSVGDALGDVIYSDIATFIDGYEIQTKATEERTWVSVDDLSSFGFDVAWHDEARAYVIEIDPYQSIDPVEMEATLIHDDLIGAYVVYTDVRVFLSGELVDSAEIDGQTLIDINSLGQIGDIDWDDEARELHILVRSAEVEVLIDPNFEWFLANPGASVFTIYTEAELVAFAHIIEGTAQPVTQFNFEGRTVLLGANIVLSAHFPYVSDRNFRGEFDVQGFEIVPMPPRGYSVLDEHFQLEYHYLLDEELQDDAMQIDGYIIPFSATSIPIHAVSDFQLMRNSSGHFHLEQDILIPSQYNTVRIFNTTLNFPRDNHEPIPNFSGTLDGRGFVIRNLNVGSSITRRRAGFFSETNNATISNLGIELGVIGVRAHSTTARQGEQGLMSGGMIGYAQGTTRINNSFVTSAGAGVLAHQDGPSGWRIPVFAGGFAGWAHNLIVNNSYTRVSVTADVRSDNTYFWFFGWWVDRRGQPLSFAGGFVGGGFVQAQRSYVAGSVHGAARGGSDRWSQVGTFNGQNNTWIQNSLYPHPPAIISSYNSERRNLWWQGTSRTPAQMQGAHNQGMYAAFGFDFSRVWIFRPGENSNFPVHRRSVRDISFGGTQIDLYSGSRIDLSAAVLPSNADNTNIIWTEARIGTNPPASVRFESPLQPANRQHMRQG
jgi:hypothetical protein